MKHYKEIFALALSLTVCLALFAGCSSKDKASGTDIDYSQFDYPASDTNLVDPDDLEDDSDDSDGEDDEVDERKSLIMGFDADFPPYGYVDEIGAYVGFDIDLAKELCQRRGWELKLQPIDWAQKDKLINSGEIDCIWNGFTINGREDDYTWSDAYIDNTQIFVVKESSGIKTIADLEGKRVAVQSGSSAETALSREDIDNKDIFDSFSVLIKTPEYNTAFLSLEEDTVDAIAMDISVADYHIALREGDGKFYTILDEEISLEQYGIGFEKGNTLLRDQVQETLMEMHIDGTLAEIARNWELEDFICLGK